MTFPIHFNEFFSAQDDMAHHSGMIRQNTDMYVVEMAFVVILMSLSMPRMTWRTIRDDTAEHGMYVVEIGICSDFNEFFRWR